MKRLLYLFLFFLTFSLVGCTFLEELGIDISNINSIIDNNDSSTYEDQTSENDTSSITTEEQTTEDKKDYLDPNGYYTSKDDVALFIHQYGRLPNNYITKGEAQAKGWVPSKNNLWQVTDRASIGGDRFYNREGLLPDKPGRVYYECDIDYNGKSRGAKRIVFSNDGLIYYTADHYKSFIKLYGDE